MTASNVTEPKLLDVLPADTEREESVGLSDRLHRGYLKLLSTSWLFSALLHALALFAIGRLFLPLLPTPPVQELVMGETAEAVDQLEEFQELSISTHVSDHTSESRPPIETELLVNEPELALPKDEPMLARAEPVMTMADSISDLAAPAVEAGSIIAARSGMTASELRHAGGNTGSETAVRESLIWLVNHQLPDGGWTLQHNRLVHGCTCGNSGFKQEHSRAAPQAYEARFGATGLALLPFLGSGRTHRTGEYQQVVEAGLAYLVNNMQQEGERAILRDKGNYYSHGICTIAICEAFAMTKDPALAAPAQALINEIIYGQDPVGGGWRYTPKQPGDTSVTGWQFMALKSAKMAGLRVPNNVIERANTFLDAASYFDGAYAASDGIVTSVSPDEVVVRIPPVIDESQKTIKNPPRQLKYTGLDTSKVALTPGQPLAKGDPLAPYKQSMADLNGWKYRYMVIPDIGDGDSVIGPTHPTPTLSAVGILCRMYYGWESNNPLLQRTVDYLSEQGPSVSGESKVKGPNMYYNYYATQVLRHGGSSEQWSAWNEALRDFLIESQQVSGHERGSWYFGDHAHGDTHGGRLYATALASMILEVYYRHMPLYQKDVTESFLD